MAAGPVAGEGEEGGGSSESILVHYFNGWHKVESKPNDWKYGWATKWLPFNESNKDLAKKRTNASFKTAVNIARKLSSWEGGSGEQAVNDAHVGNDEDMGDDNADGGPSDAMVDEEMQHDEERVEETDEDEDRERKKRKKKTGGKDQVQNSNDWASDREAAPVGVDDDGGGDDDASQSDYDMAWLVLKQKKVSRQKPFSPWWPVIAHADLETFEIYP